MLASHNRRVQEPFVVRLATSRLLLTGLDVQVAVGLKAVRTKRNQNMPAWSLSLPVGARSLVGLILVGFSAVLTGLWGMPPAASAESGTFESQVAPLIAARCLECHNPRDRQGGLDLTSGPAASKGGESGPVLVPGKPADSLLIQRLVAGEMPPPQKGESQKLPAVEIAALESWVQRGGDWPKDRILDRDERTSSVRAGRDWWSLQPPRRPLTPQVAHLDRVRNPVDQFVLARMEKEGLTPAPPADRRTLIRRASFDLRGLPPTPEEIAAFAGDKSTDAYERLLDRLLQSEHYGERWGRYWLDLVRFAETCGYERDQLKPNIWRYRDWVIDAFNSDVPYDRFVTEQLAGDEVPWRNEQSVIATGMLRAGTWNDEPNDPSDYLYERLQDMIHATSSAFLGLTVKCARCHDHKFDPIRQTDYYRIGSFFWAGYMGQANQGGPDKNQLGVDAFGWTDRGAVVEPIRLLIKGDRQRPGSIVDPGFLSAIPQLDRPLTLPPEGSKTTQRRLQFARWMTDRDHPLTARVIVNRLWQHHFGQAIVRTPNNFGFKSDPPTHPDLLDWLAVELVSGNWQIKRLHKLIMMSGVYRQSSAHPRHEEFAEKDFTNRLWWRQNRFRLDAEALRDAMLSVSGQLNVQMQGPSFFPKMSADALEGLSRKSRAWAVSTASQRSRRSVYMMTKRSRLLPFMTTFDFSDTTSPCAQRDVTVVAPQALALLNNHFAHAQSRAMADRLLRESGSQQATRSTIRRAWQLVLGRFPTRSEVESAEAHLQEQLVHLQTHQKDRSQTVLESEQLPVRTSLELWLRADRGVDCDDQGRVIVWRDGANPERVPADAHHASQANPGRRPALVAVAAGGKPAVRFNGQGAFLQLAGQVVRSQQFSLFAVVTDLGKSGHREVISNWNSRNGNSTTSLFLGTTGSGRVRFSDAFHPAGVVQNPQQAFVITAVNASREAVTFQNAGLLARQDQALPARVLNSPYVMGTQGNINGEYWHGDIAELLVFDRALPPTEREQVWGYLASRYGIQIAPSRPDPQRLALASLCHVLLNTNEFIFVD